MAEITEHMKVLGVTAALFEKWQAEDAEDDEPAPFQTQNDALILAQRRQTPVDRIETNTDTGRRADVEVEQTREKARAGRR